MPKAELHLHIEGTLEPAQLLEIAERNGVHSRFRSVDEARRAYFGGYLSSNYVAAQRAPDLARTDLQRLARYSFEASFLSVETRACHFADPDTNACKD